MKLMYTIFYPDFPSFLLTASLLSLFLSERVLETSYHGLIKENETFVEITPLIKVDETKICGFHIIKKNKEIPFQVSRRRRYPR